MRRFMYQDKPFDFLPKKKKIYRIYKVASDFEWSPYTDDCMQVDKDITVKYVDSMDKVNIFLLDVKCQNKKKEKCIHCPLTSFTKRQYTNGKHDDVINSFECNAKDIHFAGNKVFCKNCATPDFGDYKYEEIEVE